jgi:hypothetical protein
MRLEYLLAAEAIVIDQLTNRLSIFQIIDDVAAPIFPSMLPGLSVVAGFSVARESQSTQRRAIIRLGGSALGKVSEFPVDFASHGPHHRLVYRIENVALQREGELELELLVNELHLGKRTIAVRRTATMSAPLAPSP